MTYELYALLFSNGKRYLGITSKGAAERYAGHLRSAGKGSRLPVHCAIRKYGRPICKVLVIGEKQYIRDLEVSAILKFQTLNRKLGYNLAPGGDISPMHSKVVAAKMAATKRKRFETDPEFRKLLIAQAQHLQSPEARQRNNAAIRRPEVSAAKSKKLTGIKRFPEFVAALVLRNRSPKYREHMRTVITEVWSDPELRRQQSERFKGRIIPMEQRAQISASLMGHPGYGKGETRPEIAALMSQLTWITDGVTSRRVIKEVTPLPDGWRYGKTFKRKVPYNYVFTEEHLANMKTAAALKPPPGPKSDVTKQKLRERNLGKKQSTETIAARVLGRKNFYLAKRAAALQELTS